MSAAGWLDAELKLPTRLPRILISSGTGVRSFTLRPALAILAAVAFALFSLLYIGATAYLFFHDDILNASLSRQARMQRQYEDRIATLRSDLDRLTSRQLLNQEAVESEMSRIAGRQSALDARQDSIAALSQAVRAAGVPVDAAPGPQGADPATSVADSPASDSEETDPLPTGSVTPAEAAVISPLSFNSAPVRGEPAVSSASLSRIDRSLDHLAGDQVAFVDAVAEDVSSRADKIAGILSALGQRVPPSRVGTRDVGGPLVEIDNNADPETFRSTVELVSAEVERFGTIRRLANELPLSRPLTQAVITSGFGARLDPFLGRPAIHPGVDFAALEGSPAYATAGGTVIVAGPSGGYGNMVEIDHGNGITTRYGHLSEIDVQVGQVVPKGTVVGKTGSTGRSTGPHLHYEVRVDGAAIDPMTFVDAGHRIASLL